MRALRRWLRKKKMAKARKVALRYGIPESKVDEWVARNWNNLKKCSCWMCGNARKHFGPTRKELCERRVDS